jgi:hypothetical protein
MCPSLFGWAVKKVAGGVGVGHRVGVVDVEDQGFVQDGVAPDLFEADAARLVLAGVVG